MRRSGFLATGVKRIFDDCALYAQLVITDNCNLSCGYCNEYIPGAPPVPLPTLQRRIDKLHELGVLVYDLLGGEPLLHPDLCAVIRYLKARRSHGNMVIVITNGFLLDAAKIAGLNDAGLDMMQISIDSITPTRDSHKALKTVLPKLHLLAREARFQVKIQSVLTPQTCQQYDEFRRLLASVPFDFSFSLLHEAGGRIAIQGEQYVRLLEEHDLFAGMQFYRQHVIDMLRGNHARPWKCLGGSKFLYVTAAGEVQFCSQNQEFRKPLFALTRDDLRRNNRHKACEAGCALGCARSVSHALGHPLQTLRTSLALTAKVRQKPAVAAP